MPQPLLVSRPEPTRAPPSLGIGDALPKWEHLFHYARWGIAVTQGDAGRLDWVNPAFAEMHGYAVEELEGADIIDVFAPEHRADLHEHVRMALEAGHRVFESVHLRKDGSSFPVEVDVSVMRDAEGRTLFRAAQVRDISERRRAEEARRESEAQALDRLAELEHVYATTPIGIALHDTESRLLRISERLAAIDGLSVADHIGRPLREILPDVAGVLEPIIGRVVATGEPVLDVEIETRTPALPWIVALVSFHPLKSVDGCVRAVSVGVQDISAQKRAEQSLRESEERLTRILESAMDAIVTLDESQRITLFNAAAEDVFRCKAPEVLGQSFDRFATPALRDVLTGSIRAFQRISVKKQYVWAPEGLSAVRANGEVFPIEATMSQAESGGRKLFTLIMRDVQDRRQAEERLGRLQAQNVFLRTEVGTEYEVEDIVGRSKGLREVLQAVELVAQTDSTVLITGETGTGKELVARAIHEQSRRRDQLLVTVNCAALPGGLIESELFGHEKGAFTGALSQKIGRFEMADRGTLFLDEIGDMPLELQAKLLRVLQEGEFERVGGSQKLRSDVRVIAATNRDLGNDVDTHRFRADLYYRLNVFPIHVPPLRNRKEDIPLLARHFAVRHASRLGKRIDSISAKAMAALQAYAWPGNVRELQNVLERAVIISRSPVLDLGEWPPVHISQVETVNSIALEDVEKSHIMRVLEATHWRVSGPAGAAEKLGLKPTTLQARMKKLGIRRPT